MYRDNILHARDHYAASDKRFALPAGSFDFRDQFTDEAAFMRSVQLLDRETWAKFVKLFKNPGVDDADHGWRCEYWGKMMRGACFTYAASPADAPDDELYAVLEETVRDMLTAQDGLGRFSTYSTAVEFHGWDIWGRKYILLGMIYFLDICRDDALADEIVEALKRHLDYMIEKLGREEDGKLVIAACTDHWDGLNSCSLLEPVMLLYNIVKEPRYLEFAEYIVSFGGTLHKNLFELAYEDETPIHQYHVTKAYEMISCFEGLAEYAKVTGDEHYRQAVLNFGARVLREEATIIGCLGCEYESFDHAAAEQFNENHRGVMQETCVTVTWMKFLWQLWRMSGDVKYIDALERSAYNAMSASIRRHIDPEANGGVKIPIHSYNPLRHEVRFPDVGGRKMIDEKSYYGCCVCISTAGFALDTLAAAGVDRAGRLYINLIRGGTITLPDITVKMETDTFQTVKFTVKGDDEFWQREIAVRLPAWSNRQATLSVNHTRTRLTAKPDGYVRFIVQDGAEFELFFHAEPRFLTPADVCDTPTDVTNYVAVQHGPVIYALDETEENEPVIPLTESAEWSWTKGDFDECPATVPCRSALTLDAADGGTVTLVDYASAGQEEGHRVCAWIKTK